MGPIRSTITFELFVVWVTVCPGILSELMKSTENKTGPSASLAEIVFVAVKSVPLPVLLTTSPFIITVGGAIKSVFEVMDRVTSSLFTAPVGLSIGPVMPRVLNTGAP